MDPYVKGTKNRDLIYKDLFIAIITAMFHGGQENQKRNAPNEGQLRRIEINFSPRIRARFFLETSMGAF